MNNLIFLWTCQTQSYHPSRFTTMAEPMTILFDNKTLDVRDQSFQPTNDIIVIHDLLKFDSLHLTFKIKSNFKCSCELANHINTSVFRITCYWIRPIFIIVLQLWCQIVLLTKTPLTLPWYLMSHWIWCHNCNPEPEDHITTIYIFTIKYVIPDIMM